MAFYLVPLLQGRAIVLDKAIVFVGRHPECDVVLTDSRKVSRKHCCLAQVNDQFVIRDLGSMNGIRVNGRKVDREARLRIGDEVAIGDVRFRLQAWNGEPPRRTGAPADRQRPAARGPLVRPPLAANLSQEFPVPIPEPDEEFPAPHCNDALADSEPLIEAVSESSLADDGDDDVVLVEESGEYHDHSSHVSR